MKANFGFKEVEADQKQDLVGEVFSSVAKRYDLMNDLMSFGLHRVWKNIFVNQINPGNDAKFLDVAGGTGDIAFRIYEKFLNKNPQIIVTDINKEMLEEGRKRALNKNIKINFEQHNGEKLGFLDNKFDFYTIAFGIRNFTNIDKALSEAYRVLKPGGKFLCMEFSPLEENNLGKMYDFYSFNIIPKIGDLVTKNREAYQYLVESIRRFPDKEKFTEMIRNTGFEQVKFQSLNLGVVAIHTGWKI
jgi:demethylmenaquinone methyltransferase / 2-methoxy-6-polyprenyl-1,4-benzoquinol methylase